MAGILNGTLNPCRVQTIRKKKLIIEFFKVKIQIKTGLLRMNQFTCIQSADMTNFYLFQILIQNKINIYSHLVCNCFRIFLTSLYTPLPRNES
jgi:hypothetical protein